MNVYKVKAIGYIELIVAKNSIDCVEIAKEQLKNRFGDQYGNQYEFDITELEFLGNAIGRIDLSGAIVFA